MKPLHLRSHYQELLEEYSQWLELLGYVSSTVYMLSRHLLEFLLWLQLQGKNDIEQLTPKDIKCFMTYFQNRRNKRRSGGLSAAHINRQMDCLKKLSSYLELTKGLQTHSLLVYLPQDQLLERPILSIQEIEQVYEVCRDDLLGKRDRAMLSIFYGCGLRKSEGVGLQVEDIRLDRGLLKVSKSKTGRGRYVPMAFKVVQDVQDYIYTSRPLLIGNGETQKALFISERGLAIQGQSLYVRFKTLLHRCQIDKSLGLHGLRHSIATHLLARGMRLEDIARFLGHTCLDSTQLYTHLKGLSDEENDSHRANPRL